MNRGTRTAGVSPVREERKGALRQRPMALVTLTIAIVIDQVTKWWAWRHVSDTIINYGGDVLVGRRVGGWYADPVGGALLDLLGFGLLSTAVAVLLRRRRPAMVLVPGALVIGGWGSNLLDRLGLHYWTAPGSMRGAMDFIHLGRDYYNFADFFIIGGTLLFVLGIGRLARRAENRPATIGSAASPYRLIRPRTRRLVLAAAVGLVAVVGMGAANHSGLTSPLAPASPAGR
jgi:lipoprotein signal peptidase